MSILYCKHMASMYCQVVCVQSFKLQHLFYYCNLLMLVPESLSLSVDIIT